MAYVSLSYEVDVTCPVNFTAEELTVNSAGVQKVVQGKTREAIGKLATHIFCSIKGRPAVEGNDRDDEYLEGIVADLQIYLQKDEWPEAIAESVERSSSAKSR